jgi:hypothetical protein
MELALKTLIFLGLSLTSYLILLFFFGFTYELFFFSNLIFLVLGLTMLFLGGFNNPAFSHLLLPVGFAFTEELLLNSVFAGWGLGLAFLGLILFPLLGVFVGSRGGDARVVFEVCGLLFATRVVLSPFPIHLLESPSALPSIYTLIMAVCIFYLWFRRIPLGSVGFRRGNLKILKQVLVYWLEES